MANLNSAAPSLPRAADRSRRPWRRIWVFVLLGAHAGLLGFGAWRQTPTVDEPIHLAGGIWSWHFGRFDLNRGNPPLVGTVAAFPVLWAQPETDWSRAPDSFAVGQDLLDANGIGGLWLITLGRWALIPFSLLGGYICFRWASELYGYGSGLVALTLWCFDPNIIAHGQLITGDVAATAIGVTAFYAFWKWLDRPSLGQAALVGIALGLVELTKYLWVILFALWPVLWLIWRLQDLRPRVRFSCLRELGQGILIVLLGVWVINLGYAFDRPLQPLEHFRVGRKVLADLGGPTAGEGQPTTRAGPTWLASFPVPLPEDYVGGVDEISQRFDSKPWTYLCGQWRPGGWWYYYFYAFLIKLPLGTLALLALAAVFFAVRRDCSAGETSELFLFLSVLIVLAFVTTSGSTQRLRYALPIFPFVFIWASKTGRVFAGKRRLLPALVAACLAWSVASSLWVYPHSNSYFNAVAGGPAHGHEHLIESNVEWGQDLVYLKQWLDRHPEARPLHLAYFGRVDPRVMGIEFSLPPKKPGPRDRGRTTPIDEQGPQPGWHAVSVNLLQGHGWEVPDGRGGQQWLRGNEFEYLFRFRPVGTGGYSIPVYHIECSRANEVRRQLGMPPTGCNRGPNAE